MWELKIGKYRIGLKSSTCLLVPLIMWGIVIAYMLQSRSLYSDNAMLLVRWCFYAMIIFTILSVKGDLTIQREGDIKDEPVKGNAPGGLNHETIRLFVFIVSIGVYLVIMEWLGFIITTLVFIAGMMFYLGVRSKKLMVLVPVCLTMLIYLMFDVWLSITLPVSIFGF